MSTASQSCCSTRSCCPTERRYPDLEAGARLFKALGDETRLAILKQLREQGEVCACEFLACCEVAQPTVSHHLKVLRDAGLVNAEKRGLWVHYTLNEKALDALRTLLP
jgi:ArsR family transcriptional regulator, arsenate/arsenite/antimonite-responsive transcriptional repressor